MLQDASPGNLQWLAGLLEGEGYFGIRRAGANSVGTRAQLRVTLKMTDEDVVRRAAAVMGAVSVGSQPAPKAHWSPYWYCGVYGRRAEALMRRLRPYMGARRGAKIDQLLALQGLSHR